MYILLGFMRTIFLFATGRVKFYKESIGREVVMEDGKRFTVFRHVKIKPFRRDARKPEAVFIIRFLPKDMSIEENKKFSRLPMMIFMGFRGFASKFWMVDETSGLCQGLYEWDTLRDAENYSKSTAVRFMTKRSVPGSVTFEILPQREEKYWHYR